MRLWTGKASESLIYMCARPFNTQPVDSWHMPSTVLGCGDREEERKAWPLLLRDVVGEETQPKDHVAVSKQKPPG